MLRRKSGGSKAPCAGNSGAIFKHGNAAGADFTLQPEGPVPFFRFASLPRLQIEPSQHVLDIGSGIGGPAGTLVAEQGCIVTGLELTAEFIRAADMLNGLLGMTDDVDFIQGSATNIPTRAQAFDLVWSQNMLMNVKDKAQLFREVFRVTKPGGKVAFETAIAGEGGAPHLPTFWAARPDQYFLTSADATRQLAIDAGFIELAFEDTTDAVIANGRKRVAAMNPNNTNELGLDVIVTSAVEKQMENSICNNLEGRTGAIQALFQRLDRCITFD